MSNIMLLVMIISIILIQAVFLSGNLEKVPAFLSDSNYCDRSEMVVHDTGFPSEMRNRNK